MHTSWIFKGPLEEIHIKIINTKNLINGHTWILKRLDISWLNVQESKVVTKCWKTRQGKKLIKTTPN
ncbi:unnamed protein product [Allacma fusca]|uniref:Uncharacterized protein n=1 Tax=Allacma fusca TaxID=39272 RepID=A0A8J2MGE0_9HEXA|nr:unnamed protein product [Allacma fusca]